MYRTLLRFSPEHQLSREIVADAHVAHTTAMSGFDHLIEKNDFFSDHNRQQHADHRAAYNVLHSVNIRGNGEIRMIIQSSVAGQWENVSWRDALIESASVIEVDPLVDGQLRYEITANPVQRKNGGKNRVPISDHDGIMAWWTRRAEQAGLSLVGEPRLVRTERRNVSTKKFKMATATIQGFATVADAELLADAYTTGIGQCKAYGCGLLLTKRPHVKRSA